MNERQEEMVQLRIQIKQLSSLKGMEERFVERKGIFVINEASQMEQRSRSASGNQQRPQERVLGGKVHDDLQYKYELMESANRKLATECECLRKKCIEYEFK